VSGSPEDAAGEPNTPPGVAPGAEDAPVSRDSRTGEQRYPEEFDRSDPDGGAADVGEGGSGRGSS
jgi:hypothetical protein